MKKFHINKKKKVKTKANYNPVNPEGNRKTRRKKKSLATKSPKSNKDHNHWYKRIVKEMIQCPQVQDLVASGKVDKLLE